MQAALARQARLQLGSQTLRRSRPFLNSRELFALRAVSTDATVVKEGEKLWDIQLLYDGECPLCLKEINMLKERDDGRGKISFVNIATPEYDPEQNSGISYGKAMGRIHGILPDGNVIEGIEVFRRCYDAVGLGWVYAFTSWKPAERFANAVYNLWARYRLPLTGRSTDGIENMHYWSASPKSCADEESCDISWGEADNEGAKK